MSPDPEAQPPRAVPRPSDAEMMANLLLGPDEFFYKLPHASGRGVRATLEDVVADALCHSPCIISFSGGRDSSAVLALAIHVARRHALPLPIPATMRFTGAPESEEATWQKLVLEHLGLRDVEVLNLTDELDALGSASSDVLCRHGVRWPGNAYMHRPVFEAARGGSVLTGIGGDELFSTNFPRRSVRQLALAAFPRTVREEVSLRRHPPREMPWLTAEGWALVRRALARDEVRYPHRWDRALPLWYSSRVFAGMNGTISLVADDCEVKVVNPFLDARVIADLAALGGRRGFPSRAAAMRQLFGDLLPEASMTRPTKASFGGAVWGPAVREFAQNWDGSGLDGRYVDVAQLRAELLRPEPDFRTVLLLHQAWVSSLSSSAASS